MKRIIPMLILALAVVAAAQSVPTPIAGQQVIGSSPMYWMPNSSARLYVTSTGYLRDSAGTRRPVDTTLNSVGGNGACTSTFSILTNGLVGLESNFELSYGIRATDPAQYGVRMYFATRNKAPADTTWRIIHYMWNNARVITWHVPDSVTTTRSYRAANFYLSGQDARVCVERYTPALGAGDTTVLDNLFAKLR